MLKGPFRPGASITNGIARLAPGKKIFNGKPAFFPKNGWGFQVLGKPSRVFLKFPFLRLLMGKLPFGGWFSPIVRKKRGNGKKENLKNSRERQFGGKRILNLSFMLGVGLGVKIPWIKWGKIGPKGSSKPKSIFWGRPGPGLCWSPFNEHPNFWNSNFKNGAFFAPLRQGTFSS